MKKKLFLSLLLVASMSLSLAACGGTSGSEESGGGDSGSDDPIVIGTISPNTGSLAAYGTGIITGVELAVEEINAAGGILGRQVEVITTDDQGDPTECLNAFNSLVAEGCRIEGTVVNSILFPGVTVEKGAKVEDCILFRGTTVREAARLSHVITDKHVELLPGRTMVGHTAYPIVIAKGSVI